MTTKTETTFRLEYAVSTTIRATPAQIWKQLADAKAQAKWNSTLSKLEGTIAKGEKLRIEVPVAPGRAFTPKVAELVENERMVWSDGMAPMFKGERTFTLSPKGDGTTEFEMREVFSGLMLPMIRGSLPDFRPVFDTYAADLKRACEG